MRMLATILALAILPAAADAAEGDIVTTRRQVTVEGRVLKYTARAGTLPIRENETGEVHGNMFFVSYTLDRAAGQAVRPLTFLWNGGPGSSSSLVHLLGFGPRRVESRASAVDNPDTWLDFTDLVFVDPIGTGYSRPTKAEYAQEFYQNRGDAESVAEFIRVYRNRFEAWESPVFLTGESFGVTRAAGVADVLERRRITVAGVVLIGLALPLGEMTGDLRTALMVPTYTASAFVNKKLAPELQADLQSSLRQAESWAKTDYAAALSRRDALTEAERQSVTVSLSRFTGLPASAIDPKTLSVGMAQFSEQLLRSENKVVGRYDARLTGPFDPTQKMYDPTKDPSLENIIDDVGVVRYLRGELKYESDLQYQGPFGGGYPPATAFRGDWMSVKWNRTPEAGGTPGAAPAPQEQPLRRAMTANPKLRVLVGCGYYDLVCSYAGNAQLASGLPPELKQNVHSRGYGGGHAIYTDATARRQLKEDVRKFFGDAPAVPPRAPQAALSSPDESFATTKHTITMGSRTLKYTARAGRLPIRHNETGEVRGHVFVIAYELDGESGGTRMNAGSSLRPLTFLWNGGPGANSLLVHLNAFGPRRVKTADSPLAPRTCECEMEDNQTTWLDKSDLVFVDPIGTGFSRPTRPEYAADFLSTLGDIAATAELVRVYLTRFDAWDRPLFLAGESFGVWRAAGAAEALELRGHRVSGLMLISGGMALGPVGTQEMRDALFIPTRTAAAFFHKKLAPDLQADLQGTLQKSESWAGTEYAAALARRDSLDGAARDAVIAGLSRFTGLDASLIDKQTLVVARQGFAEQLLQEQKRVLGRFDTRQTTGGEAAGGERASLVSRYLRSVLGYKTDLAYDGLEEGYLPAATPRRTVNARWNYNVPEGTPPPRNADAPPGAQPWLRRAIALNPSLRAFVAAGLYDSLNSCAVNRYIVRTIEPQVAGNVTAACYEGGHMMYEDVGARLQLKRDVDRFFDSTLAAPTARR